MRAISIRVQRVKGRRRGWVAHDWRADDEGRPFVPGYATPAPPDGGRVVTVFGERPRDDLSDVAAQVSAARARLGRYRGGRVAAAWGGVLTLGREAQRDVAEGRAALEDLDRTALNALRDLFGESLVYVVRHRDEAAPHWHFLVRNTRPGDGHAWQFSRSDLSQMQDRVAAHFRPFGWTRGRRKEDRVAAGEPVSRWTHRTVAQLHQSLLIDAERAEEARRAAEEVLARADSEAKRLCGEAEAAAARLAELRQAESRVSERLSRRREELAAVEAALASAEAARERHAVDVTDMERRRQHLLRAIAREEGRLSRVRSAAAEVMGGGVDASGFLPVSRARARRWAEAAAAAAVKAMEEEIGRLVRERDEARREVEQVRGELADLDLRLQEAEVTRRLSEDARKFYRSVLDGVSAIASPPRPAADDVAQRVRQILSDQREREVWARCGVWWDAKGSSLRSASVTPAAAATTLFAARKLGWGAVLCQPPEWARLVAEEAASRRLMIEVQAMGPDGRPVAVWVPPSSAAPSVEPSLSSGAAPRWRG